MLGTGFKNNFPPYVTPSVEEASGKTEGPSSVGQWEVMRAVEQKNKGILFPHVHSLASPLHDTWGHHTSGVWGSLAQ